MKPMASAIELAKTVPMYNIIQCGGTRNIASSERV